MSFNWRVTMRQGKHQLAQVFWIEWMIEMRSPYSPMRLREPDSVDDWRKI